MLNDAPSHEYMKRTGLEIKGHCNSHICLNGDNGWSTKSIKIKSTRP